MSSILHVIGFAIEEFTLCNEICFESSIYLFIYLFLSKHVKEWELEPVIGFLEQYIFH